MPVTNAEVKQIAASDYLNEISKIKERIRFRENEVQEMRCALDVSGINYDLVSANSVSKDALPEAVLRFIDLLDGFYRELDIYQEQMKDAVKVIESLPPDVEDIARKHYIECITWADLERELHYSHTSMMKKRKRILIIVYDLMNEAERRKFPKAI